MEDRRSDLYLLIFNPSLIHDINYSERYCGGSYGRYDNYFVILIYFDLLYLTIQILYLKTNVLYVILFFVDVCNLLKTSDFSIAFFSMIIILIVLYFRAISHKQ